MHDSIDTGPYNSCMITILFSHSYEQRDFVETETASMFHGFLLNYVRWPNR